MKHITMAGTNAQGEYQPDCSCGWVGPVCATLLGASELALLHKRAHDTEALVDTH